MKTSIYLLLAVVTFASVAVGQSHKDKLEVGVHSSAPTVFDPDFVGDVTHTGIGGRVTYNLNRSIAAEAEVNFFPQTQLFASAGGNSFQAQFGVKAGKRFEKFGVFAKLRPGFLNVDDVFSFVPGPVVNGIPTLDFKIERTTLFTLDIGGVLEFYPSNRLLVRFDGGDTVIRYPRKVQPVFGGQALAFIERPPQYKHNFQFTAGIGFRLGDFPADNNATDTSSSSGSERVPRYELGAQFTSLLVDDPTNDCGFCLLRNPQFIHTEPGFGGRFTLNLTENIAVELHAPLDRLPQSLRSHVSGTVWLEGGEAIREMGLVRQRAAGICRVYSGFRTWQRPVYTSADRPRCKEMVSVARRWRSV